ncbi:MAG TPA: phosphohistidine phosphatase SixA [Vicinamibacterales bacterium]|nr:phosphohistidine phosphatase SixA [Vicinamibacterales bacterium]
MELYLVRHGIAAERGTEWPDDSTRPLTPKGIARMGKVTAGLEALGVGLDLILTSPLVRARQTADLLHQGLGGATPLEETALLAPGGKPADLVDHLRSRKKSDRIALVGHEPDLGQLAAFLIGARAPLVFKKGGICRIDFEKSPPVPPGQLVWFALPRMLRAL